MSPCCKRTPSRRLVRVDPGDGCGGFWDADEDSDAAFARRLDAVMREVGTRGKLMLSGAVPPFHEPTPAPVPAPAVTLSAATRTPAPAPAPAPATPALRVAQQHGALPEWMHVKGLASQFYAFKWPRHIDSLSPSPHPMMTHPHHHRRRRHHHHRQARSLLWKRLPAATAPALPPLPLAASLPIFPRMKRRVR